MRTPQRDTSLLVPSRVAPLMLYPYNSGAGSSTPPPRPSATTCPFLSKHADTVVEWIQRCAPLSLVGPSARGETADCRDTVGGWTGLREAELLQLGGGFVIKEAMSDVPIFDVGIGDRLEVPGEDISLNRTRAAAQRGELAPARGLEEPRTRFCPTSVRRLPAPVWRHARVPRALQRWPSSSSGRVPLCCPNRHAHGFFRSALGTVGTHWDSLGRVQDVRGVSGTLTGH